MKRARMKDDLPWEDPNKLKISELQKVLSKFQVQYDKSERRTRLFQRYVQLARIESPDSVELWTGKDFLVAPLPAADQLVVPTLKIFLALHGVDYPAQASRGHLIKLYNSLPTAINPPRRASLISVNIPTPTREQKKRRTAPPPVSPAPVESPSLCEENSRTQPESSSIASHAGKTRHPRTRASVVLPYSRQSQRLKASKEDGKVLRSSKRPSLPRASKPSEGRSLRPRLPSVPEIRDKDNVTPSRATQGRCLPRTAKPYQRSTSSHDGNQSIMNDGSCIASSSASKMPAKKNKKTSTRPPSSQQTPSSWAGARHGLSPRLLASEEDELASITTSVLKSPSVPLSSTRSSENSQNDIRDDESERDIPQVQESQPSERDPSSRGSPGLLESQENELTSNTSEVDSMSGTSRSTWLSEKSRSELHHDDQSSNHSISVGETPMQPTDQSSRSLQEQPLSQLSTDDEDELASSTAEIRSLSAPSRSTRHTEDVGSCLNESEFCIDNNINSQLSTGDLFYGRPSRAAPPKKESRSREEGSSSLISRSSFKHPESSYIHPCNNESKNRSIPIGVIRRPILEDTSEFSIDAMSHGDQSSAVGSVSSPVHSDCSTVVPSRQAEEPTAQRSTIPSSPVHSDCSTVVPSHQVKESTAQPTSPSTGGDFGRQSVPPSHDSTSSEVSSFSKDNQSESIRQQASPTPSVLNSLDVDNVRGEEAPSQRNDHGESQSDDSSTPTNHNTSDPAPKCGNRKQLKRKVDDPSKWPDASELSRSQIEAYLDDHDVLYNRGARMARLIGSYNILRSSLSHFHNEERPDKRRRTPRSRSNTADSLHLARRPHRRNRRKACTNSDQDDPGFVYSRPESQDRRPLSPAPSSVASESNYQPSVAPTIEPEPEPFVADVSELSISTHSTRRRRRDSPTNTSKKRLKKAVQPDPPATRRRGRPRKHTAPTAIRRFRLKRAPLPLPSPSNSQVNVNHDTSFDLSLPWAQPAPPHASNSQRPVNKEATVCPPVPRAQKNKKHRLPDSSSSPDRNKTSVPPASESLPSRCALPRRQSKRHRLPESFPSHNDACVPPEPLQSTSARPRRKRTQIDDRQERSRRNSYTAYPSFHDDEPLLPPVRIDHLNPDGPLCQPAPPPVQQQSEPDHLAPTQDLPLHQSDDLALGNPTRKRKQPDDLSPQERSKRQVRPLVNRLLTPGPSASLRSSTRRVRRRQERVRGNSYTPRPSMHDEFPPLDPMSINRATNVEAWRSSLPPTQHPSSPLVPPRNVHRTHDQSTSGQCDCRSNEYLVHHLTRIADNVESIANRGICNSNQGQVISSRPSRQRNDLSLLARVRLHIRALLGKCMELNQFPPPATEQEKAYWQRTLEDESDNESVSNSSTAAAVETRDPAFPYRNGPGHRDLSAATLAIMWRSMQRAGVASFRPDFSRGPRDVDNVFLWNLAHSIFIRLVKAGEYEEIDLETTTEADIRQAIFNHAKQLNRQYREAGWNPNRLDERAVKKRRQERTRRLRDCRIKYISGKPGLAALIPVVTECTSDAETDDEGNNSELDMDGRDQDHKHVLVQALPWRHPRLTRAFALIDKLIDLKRESGCKDYGRPLHKRIRPQESINTSVHRPCAKGLPADCYNSTWLRDQRISFINSLKIQPGPELKPMIRKLEDLVDSR